MYRWIIIEIMVMLQIKDTHGLFISFLKILQHNFGWSTKKWLMLLCKKEEHIKHSNRCPVTYRDVKTQAWRLQNLFGSWPSGLGSDTTNLWEPLCKLGGMLQVNTTCHLKICSLWMRSFKKIKENGIFVGQVTQKWLWRTFYSIWRPKCLTYTKEIIIIIV